MNSPIFLVGAERSGTTLLRLLLDHHPEIAFGSEFELAVDCIGFNGERPTLPKYHAYLRQNRIFLMSDWTIDESLDYDALVQSFLEQRREASGGKPVIGATVHRHFDRLLYIWPNARFVHLIRDPRDVARSNIEIGWAGNVWTGAARWIIAERLWDALRSRLSAKAAYECRFEHLVSNPDWVLDGICQFIGVAFSQQVYSYVDDSTYELPDSRLAFQWKRTLSPNEIGLVEGRVAQMLGERGYESGSGSLICPGRMGVAALGLQDRLFRIRFAIRRFGLWFYLLERLSRWFGLHAIHKHVSENIRAIEIQHLK